jgi:hypothetical protein
MCYEQANNQGFTLFVNGFCTKINPKLFLGKRKKFMDIMEKNCGGPKIESEMMHIHKTLI